MVRFRILSQLLILGILAPVLLSFARDTPHWILVSSAHFAVLTDADETKGHEVVVRLEQMRAAFGDLLSRNTVHIPEPLDLIALKADEEYAKIAPAGQSGAGFFLAGEDRNYIVLNLAQNESWRAVSHAFAQMLMNYNYPPTQPWFDEGFAAYFSSYRPGDKKSSIGDDPESGALTTLLSNANWLPIEDLFTQRDKTRADQFRAQSWITLHYLINQNKLSETGTYFGLVQLQKLPVAQAIQQAYGVSASQLDQSIKDYFKSIEPKLQAKEPAGAVPSVNPTDTIGSSTKEVSLAAGQAQVAEMEVRLPERLDLAIRDLNAIMNDPKLDNAIAHRALAWDFIRKGDFDKANAELNEALRIDPKDPWAHYYFALSKYKSSQASKQPLQGLPNMMQDLRFALDWNPEFAEAYNMLGLARLQGGGVNAAMESMHGAIQLSPRNQRYLLNMTEIYIAGKKWDAATDMLDRLKSSGNPEIATAAQKTLADLPSLKKYGRLPEASAATPGSPSAPSSTASAPAPGDAEDSEISVSESAQPLPPPPDKRPVQYAKGKLVSVDCSQPPVAILKVALTSKTLSLRTADSGSLIVIGASQFSCDWANRNVSVNYKAGGKADGDLVSVEVK